MNEAVEQGWVKAFAPATIANMGTLFDVGGLALRGIGNQVWARLSDQPGINLRVEGLGNLSSDPRLNAVGVVANYVTRMLEERGMFDNNAPGLELFLKDDTPVSSGLGSSAASSVATAMAVNLVYGGKLSRAEMVKAARRGEQFVSGSGHADNVAPALLGGIVLVPCYDPDDLDLDIELIPLPMPAHVKENMHLAIVRPDIRVNTLEARAALESGGGLIREMVQYSGALAAELACERSPGCERYKGIKEEAAARLSKSSRGRDTLVREYLEGTERLLRALLKGDIEEVGRAVEQDRLITGRRAHFIKNGAGEDLFGPMVGAARANGAYGCSICGSGPSIFAVTDSRRKALAVTHAMSETLKRMGTEGQVFVSTINERGSYSMQ